MIRSFAYCAASTLAPMPLPLNSLPTFAQVRIEVKHNKITAITKSLVYWFIPNSHESIWYPFEMVYLIRASALLGSQSPSQRIPWLCLPLRAFKPNVTIALQRKGSNYDHNNGSMIAQFQSWCSLTRQSENIKKEFCIPKVLKNVMNLTPSYWKTGSTHPICSWINILLYIQTNRFPFFEMDGKVSLDFLHRKLLGLPENLQL